MIRDRKGDRKIEIEKLKASRSRNPREISIIFYSIPSSSNSRTKDSYKGKIRRKYSVIPKIFEI